MPIEKTIIPWTILWLCYYEEWHGGGKHPDAGNSKAA